MANHSTNLVARTIRTAQKGKKIQNRKKSPPERKVSNTEKSRGQLTNSSRKNEAAGPKWKQRSVGMCLVVKMMSDAVKKNTAWELGMLGP